MAKKIIDVSEWQGTIDFNKVKASGIAGVIIRAGYGRNNVGANFKTYIENAIKAGLPVGAYWFSYAYTSAMAEAEAEYCVAALAPYKDKITLPIFFDWEYDSNNYFKKMTKRDATKNEVTAMYSAFMGKILTKGYKAGYYTNPDFLARLIDESQIDGYYKWLAYYTNTPQTDCDIWQYGAEYIDGCSAKVDMNVLNTESLIKTPTSPVKPSDDKGGTLYYSDLKNVLKGHTGVPTKIVQSAVGSKVDGIFGTNTETDVKRFQASRGLSADGIVGPKTWEKILDLLK